MTVAGIGQGDVDILRMVAEFLALLFAVGGLLGAIYFLWGVIRALWEDGRRGTNRMEERASTDRSNTESQVLDNSKAPRFRLVNKGIWLGGPLGVENAQARSVDAVDEMSGQEFEKYIGRVLESRGFEVDQKGGTGDFGADIIASREGQRYVVQAKRRVPDSKVGPRVIRATIGACEHFGCDRAMVITNCHFSDRAKEQAGRACRLVARSELAKWIEEI